MNNMQYILYPYPLSKKHLSVLAVKFGPVELQAAHTFPSCALRRRNRSGGHQPVRDAADLRIRHHQRLQWAEHGRHGPTYLRRGRGGLQTDGQVCMYVCACYLSSLGSGLPVAQPSLSLQGL